MTEFAFVSVRCSGITTRKLSAVSMIPSVKWALTQDSRAIHCATVHPFLENPAREGIVNCF